MRNQSLSSFFFAFLTIFFALGVGLLTAEVCLRWLRPHYSYQAKALRELDSHRLLIRPSYAMTTYPHPDKDELVRVRYDRHGLRVAAGGPAYQHPQIWGFFGDSYVENLRIQQGQLFIDHLSLALEEQDQGVLNFGVEGYGPDQSYLAYLDFPHKNQLKKVFYIFCHNDLANLVENKIFDLRAGQLKRLLASELPLWKKAIGRFYLTYFALDVFHQWRGRETEKFFRPFSANRTTPWLGRKNLQARHQKRRQGPIHVGAKELKLLKRILVNWREEVESRGGEFEVVVLPDRRSHEVAQSFQGLYDQGNWHFTRSEFFEHFDRQEDWMFENDDHWNELAQKKFADYLLRKFAP